MSYVSARSAWLALALFWLMGCSRIPYAAATRDTDASGKIAPALLNAAQRLQDRATQLPLTGPVRSDSQGRMQVYVYVTSTSGGSVSALQVHGLQDVVVSPGMHVVQGWVKPEDLVNLAALPFVIRISPPQYGRPR